MDSPGIQKLRVKFSMEIIGLSDRGEITLAAIERILSDYDAARDKDITDDRGSGGR